MATNSKTTAATLVESSCDKWGPSEWFGKDVAGLTQASRLDIAKAALLPSAEAKRQCPYLTALTGRESLCSKPGGVCSVQRYSKDASGTITLSGHKVAICPSRLVSKTVLNEIAKKVLGPTVQPVLVKEVPYAVSLTNIKKSGEPTAAGRIDWLLVDREDPSRFCAVETQSVYMSGPTQDETFKAFVDSGGLMAMPPSHRHPDYKSSVPKRLAPQLESKARHLSSASRKTVVLVDEFVRSNMSHLQEVSIPAAYAGDPAKAAQHRLNNCEVIFTIVSLDAGLTITASLYCMISAAKDALNAVAAMSHVDFENIVKDLVQPKKANGDAAATRPDKVFKLF